jgi:hypothetical protein
MRREFMAGVIGRVLATCLCGSLLWTLALSVMPQWHELIHPDANAPRHECAVTLAGSGNQQQPAPLVALPVPVLQFCFVAALHPIWVPSAFFGAHIFEHAPPALA